MRQWTARAWHLLALRLAWDLINGRLMKPIDVSLRMSNTYWIVCPKVVSGVPKVATFRDWLLAEAGEDARRLKALARRRSRKE